MSHLSYQADKSPEDIIECECIDTAWHMISQLKDSVTGKPKFSGLSRVMLTVLTIPFCNADGERIFSQVIKNRTEFRSKPWRVNTLLTHSTQGEGVI